MDNWISSETHRRRDEMLSNAARARIVKMSRNGSSRSIRGRIADGAQAVSDVLEHFAHVVREREA